MDNAAHSPHAWAMDSVEWDPFAFAATSAGSGESELGSSPINAGSGDALTPRLRYARSGGCQVPGCTSTLALTTYQRRAMLCGTHINADTLQLPCSPLAVRFCQKCRRLHALSDFSGKQHTCRAALTLVRQRRKAKRRTDLSEDSLSPPPPGSEQNPTLDLDSLSSLLLGSQGWAGDTALDTPAPLHPYNPQAPPAPPAPDADDWLIPLPECVSLELKLPLLPTAALPPAGVRSEILASLSMQVGTGTLSPGRAAAVAAQLFGAIKPGCTHLTVDATFVAPLPRDSLLHSADAAGAALLAGAPSMAAAGRMEVGLRRCGALGSVACAPAGGTPLAGASQSSPLHVSPMALLSGVGGSQLTLRLSSGRAAPSSVSVRLNGQVLRVPTPLSSSDGSLVVTLPPSDAEGCACVDAGEGVSSQPLCVVLFSASERLVDEVNAAARATSPHAQRTLGALQQACWAVGQALALRQPHVGAATPPARARLLALHGAACSLRFGWHAALEECLALAAEEEEEDGWEGSEAATAALTSSGSTLLHQAAQAACPVAAACVLQLRPQLRGGCGQPDASGSSALHVAARRGAGGVLAALCAERPAQALHDDASTGQEGARALLAFWAAREGPEKGAATPAQLAQRHPELAPLTAHLRRRVADAARLAYASLPSGPPLGLASLAVAHRRLRESPPSPHTAVALELLRSLLAGATRRDQALTAARVQADAHALLSYASLTCGMYCLCLLSRSALGLMTDQELNQSLQQSAWQPDWETWQRIPTCMCGHMSSHIQIWLLRAFMTATAIRVALVALAAGEARRCRLGTTVSLVHCALLANVLILDPAWQAVSTYRRFGGVGVLRRPWRGGTVLLVTTVLSHLFSATRPPPRTYAAIMVCRGVVPLLARGALAGPAVLQWLAWIKLVDASPWFDRLNILVALAAAAHTAAAHRARQRPLAPKAC